MAHALDETRQRLERVPVYNDDLARQLAEYQRRAVPQYPSPTPHHGEAAPPYHTGATPFRAVSQTTPAPTAASVARATSRPSTVGAASVWRDASRVMMPPEIERPAAVQWLLDYEGRFDPNGAEQQPQGASTPATRRAGGGDSAAQPTSGGPPKAAARGEAGGGPPRTPKALRQAAAAAAAAAAADEGVTPRSRTRRRRVGADVAYSAMERLRLRTTGATGIASSSGDDEASPTRRIDRERREREAAAVLASHTSATELSTDAARGAVEDPHNVVSARPKTLPRSGSPGGGAGVTATATGGGPAGAPHHQQLPVRGGGGAPSAAAAAAMDDDGETVRLDPIAEEAWAWRKLERVDDNIERALARRGIQQSRLRERGELAPGTKVTDGVQTDAPPDDRSVAAERISVAHPRLVDEAAHRLKEQQRESGTSTSMQTPSGGGASYMLHPMGQQPHVTPQKIARANAGMSPDAAEPSAAAAADGGASRQQDREWSLAWVRSPENRDGGAPPTTEAGRAAANVSDVRDTLMSRLDQLQLENEESLVANRLVEAADGGPGADRRAAEALLHVGAANRRGANVPPPAGGYGSVAEGTHVPGLSDADEEERWRMAKMTSERENNGFVGNDGINTRAMRQWASEHRSQTAKKVGKSELPGGPAMRDPYSARRKWGAVSFGSDATLPPSDPAAQERHRRLDIDYRIEHMQQAEREAAAAGAAVPAAAAASVAPADEVGDVGQPQQLRPGFSQASYGFLDGRNEGLLDKTHREMGAMYPGEALASGASPSAAAGGQPAA